MALNLILHTFRMIFGNLGQALRVSVFPYVLLVVVVVILLTLTGSLGVFTLDRNATYVDGIPQMNPLVVLVPLFLLPMILFVTAWVAVSWHRFILLEEYAGWLPAVKGRPIWPYVGKAILLTLIIIAIAVPLFFVLGLFASAPMSSTSGSFSGTLGIVLLIYTAAAVLLSFIGLRLGVALVGTALGKPMGFGDAWRATSNVSGVIFGVVVILVLINTVPGMLLSWLTLYIPIIATILNIALSWVTMMLGVSILTTLYGHVIEERPLPQ